MSSLGPCSPRSPLERPSPSPARPSPKNDEDNPRRQVRSAVQHQRRKGHCGHHFDPAPKLLTWKVTYSGLTGPATAAPFPRPGRTRQECRRHGADPECRHQPGRRHRHTDRRPGRRPDGRQVLRQRPHRSQSGRRNPRSGDEVKRYGKIQSGECASARRLFLISTRKPQLLRRYVSWQLPHALPIPAMLAFSVSRSFTLALGLGHGLREARDVRFEIGLVLPDLRRGLKNRLPASGPWRCRETVSAAS